MIPVLTSNTQAILLLTSPLITGGGAENKAELLSAGEYKRFARHLMEINSEPAALLRADAPEILESCRAVVDPERVKQLLGRGFQLTQAVERWHARAIWVISRADPEYPVTLKSRLSWDAPAVLFGCGDFDLLRQGGLAVVGSRHAGDALVTYAENIGELVAAANRPVVSGGARGIDQAAMRGALRAGGRAVGVLADSLERQVMTREHRDMISDGQLTLVSPYDPKVGFNIGNAMQRNKVIYALADAALVVSSDLKKGGTWSGAVEQLDKYHLLPVYAGSLEQASPGLDGLRKKGALEWPDPANAAELDELLNTSRDLAKAEQELAEGREGHESLGIAYELGESSQSSAPSLVDAPYNSVKKKVESLLGQPMKLAEIADAVQVSHSQMREWLSRMVDEGLLVKTKKPVAYRVAQKGLFD